MKYALDIKVDPTKYKNKIEMVTEGLKTAILSGQIPFGEKLSSEDICRTFNVSRAPVREALRRLESDGLVRIFPQQYVQVVQLDAETFKELSELRISLECLALDLFSKRITSAHLDELRTILQSRTPGMPIEKAFDVAIDFHHCLVRLSGNRELLYYYSKIMDRFKNFLRLQYKNNVSVISYHDQLIELLAKKQFESAKTLLIEDIHDCEGDIYSYLEDINRK